MIDMHAHWRPAELADALRARTKDRRITRNADGAEGIKIRSTNGARTSKTRQSARNCAFRYSVIGLQHE